MASACYGWHLRLGLPGDMFLSGFPMKFLCSFLVFLMLWTWPAYLTLLEKQWYNGRSAGFQNKGRPDSDSSVQYGFKKSYSVQSRHSSGMHSAYLNSIRVPEFFNAQIVKRFSWIRHEYVSCRKYHIVLFCVRLEFLTDVGYNTVKSIEIQQMFRRNILSPSSGSKNKTIKKPVWSR
jgi:hypothetical protein